jgi:prepilin-type processing-associated H-X9-DG protein
MELLVVIAIVAILAALLVPILGGGMQRAKLTKAQSNLRQIFISFTLYATDHNQKWPAARTPNTTSGQHWSRSFLLPYLYDVGEVSNVEMFRMNTVFNSPGSSQAFLRSSGFSSGLENAMLHGYGYNVRLPAMGSGGNVGDSGATGEPRPLFLTKPSSTALLLDAVNFAASPSASDWPQVELGAQRWNGKVNVLFTDGHTEILAIENVPSEAESDEGWLFWRGRQR